jgi:hypothetical protein
MLREEKYREYRFHGITVKIRLAERQDGAWAYHYLLTENTTYLGGSVGVHSGNSSADQAEIAVRTFAEDHVELILTKRFIKGLVERVDPNIT